MNNEERIEWVSTLQVGDFVAHKAGSGHNYWAVAKITRITPSRRMNLSNGTIINPDGSIRGDKYFCIHPVTEDIRMKVWRQKAIYSLKKDLKIENLTNEQLKLLLEVIKV